MNLTNKSGETSSKEILRKAKILIISIDDTTGIFVNKIKDFNLKSIGIININEDYVFESDYSNYGVLFKTFNTALTETNILNIIEEFEIVIDMSCDLKTRFLINDACVLRDKIYLSSSINGNNIHVSLFNYPMESGGRSPNFRDLFPKLCLKNLLFTREKSVQNSVQKELLSGFLASELLKIITKKGTPLSGKQFIFDALNSFSRTMYFYGNHRNKITQLIDYNKFYFELLSNFKPAKEISAAELKDIFDNKEDIQLIDLREHFEKDIATLNGFVIPPSEILTKHHLIEKDKKVIFYCRTGRRTGIAVRELEEKYGYSNLFSLKGGINAYSRIVDPTIQQY